MLVSDLLYEDRYDDPRRFRWLEIINEPSPEKGMPFAGGQDIHGKQFGYIAKRSWGNFAAIAVWNPEHTGKADLAIDNMPVVDLTEQFHVWSFWQEKYLGQHDVSFQVKDVPSYHSRLLRVTPVDPTGRPTLIGSNFHITMGAAELENVANVDDGLSITLAPHVGADSGQFWVHSKLPLQVVSDNASIHRTHDENVYVLLITQRQRTESTVVKLEPSNTAPSFLDRASQSYAATSILPLAR